MNSKPQETSINQEKVNMKLTKLYISAIAMTLFTGVAVAAQDETSDVLKYNVDKVKSKPAQEYNLADVDSRDNRDDLKRKAESVTPASPHVPYVKTDENMDDNKNLIDMTVGNN